MLLIKNFLFSLLRTFGLPRDNFISYLNIFKKKKKMYELNGVSQKGGSFSLNVFTLMGYETCVAKFQLQE